MICSNLSAFKRLTRENQIECVLTQGHWLEHLENPTDEELLKIINHNPLYIKYLKNAPIRYLKLAALIDPYVLRYLSNPPWEVIWEAIQANPFAAQWVENMPEEYQMKFIMMDPKNICYLRKPLKDVLVLAGLMI